MSDEAIAVFTSRSAGDILQAGGSQSWRLDPSRAKKAKYLICVRNGNGEFYDPRKPFDDWAHGAVMMVAPITGIIKAPEMPDSQPERWMVCFDQYSFFDKIQNAPNVWKELRNPVRYTTLEEMGIKLADLQFHKRSDSVSGTEVIQPSKCDEEKHFDKSIVPMNIAQAKKAMAKFYQVPDNCIEVLIKG